MNQHSGLNSLLAPLYEAAFFKKMNIFKIILIPLIYLTPLFIDGIDKNPLADVNYESYMPVISNNDSIYKHEYMDTSNDVYLFVTTEHSIEEFETLLKRAIELTYINNIHLYQVDIIMILDGPDIKLFSNLFESENDSLINLAKRLDTSGIIDFKVNAQKFVDMKSDYLELPSFIDEYSDNQFESGQIYQYRYISM